MNITSLRVLLIRPNRIFLWLQISIVVGTLAEWYLLFQEKTQEAPLASIRPGQLRWTCLHSVALLTCPTGSKQNDLPGLAAQAERYLYKVCIAKENDIPSTSTYSAETIALSLSPSVTHLALLGGVRGMISPRGSKHTTHSPFQPKRLAE